MNWQLLLKTKLNEKLNEKHWKEDLTIDETCSAKLIFINGANRGHTCPQAIELHIIKCIFLSNLVKI